MRTGSNSLNRHKCKNAQNQETSKPSPISITSQRVNSSGKRAASTRIQAKAAPVKIPTNSTQNPRVHMVMIPLLPKLLPKSVTDDLLEAQVKFLSNGMLSTNTLSDPNFLELAQQLLNVGFKFGKHRVQDFLSQSMVEDHVSDKCLKAKEVLKSEISDFSISHCVWRSKEQQFVTVYGYYLTDDFSFKTVVLGTKVCTNLSSVLPIVERLVAEFKTQSDEENSVIKYDLFVMPWQINKLYLYF